jgi:uncharacterized membrane protein HdeD (DUF308 family)
MTLQPTSSPRSLGSVLHSLSHRWGLIVGLGVLCIVLGILAFALVVSATIASVLTIGFFLIVTGGMEITLGFGSRGWGKFFLWILAGLLYVAAGAVAIAQPLMAAAFFTLMLGAGFLATGVLRLWLAFEMPPGSRALGILSGLVTALLGVLIIAGWPGNSFFILGMLLGIDLVFYGVSWIAFGLTLRRFAHNR